MKWSAKHYVVGIALLVLLLALSGCGTNGEDTSELQARISELEADNEALRLENEELQNTVASLEAQLGTEPNGDTYELEINRFPHSGWEQYFPEYDTTTLEGYSTAEVRELLGEPPFLIRSIAVVEEASREIWIFMAYEDDPTGLYLFFKGDELYSSVLDEFNGLYNSGLLEGESFWLQ
ncbi:bZIP transcription factor [Dethiobacter alkaliphilus]|uniref:Lipoprotein n=1 Tax=Dethiobacter alkaliphilus AHT 1 TaxID=555088 RepID=C0GIC1_DETAL|nr:bZIP transcription factor [Dethiobacter alkaliphilus]EEG76969.1 hypothetical protein DealDRAFT_2230 [Dethiobacter alkaliphilus AHT 1]